MKKEPVRWRGRVEKVAFPNKGSVIAADQEASQSALAAAVSIPANAPDAVSNVPKQEAADAARIRPVHVKNVLPGQIVEVTQTVHETKRREGRAVALIRRAPYEVPSLCPHSDECGGCSYQTVPYDIQLRWKEDAVRSLLAPVCDPSTYEFLPILASPLQYGYRNKMEFSFGNPCINGPLSLGLHRQEAFYDVVSTPSCMIVHPDLQKIVAFAEQFFAARSATFYTTRTHTGYLRHLVLRRSFAYQTILVNLVTTSCFEGSADEETAWLEDFRQGLFALPLEGTIAGLLHSVNDGTGDAVAADQMHVLAGTPLLTERLFDLQFEISPFSFFQTNSKGAEVLYQCALDLAGDLSGKVAFDLYCGTGTITQLLARGGAKRVYGIEIVEEAVEAARRNAKLNHLDNCEFYAGDVLKLVDQLEDQPDVIILDPPRDGIHPKALSKILHFAPKEFVYISCKPTSLARDLPMFLRCGYQLKKVRCVDMFPGTVHVETVVLLSRE